MNLVAVPVRVSRAVQRGKTSVAVGTAGAWPEDASAWLVAAVSLVLAGTLITSIHLGTDSFYDLGAGRYIIRHGIPRTNVLTVASHGAPWVDQQWLAHVLFYLVWLAGGYTALVMFSALLVTAGFAVLGLLMLRRGVPPVRMFAWTVAAFVACTGNTGVRAQSFGYLFLPLVLWLVAEDGRAERLRPRTWLAVPVLALWANTHGSVLLGAGLVGLYAAYRAARALARRDLGTVPAYLLLGASAALSVVCTPYGLGVIRYYRATVGNPAITANVTEWMPPSLGNRFSWPFFALVLATAAALVAGWRRRARPDPVLCGMAVALLAVALTAIRDQAWFAFAGSLLAAETLARGGGRRLALARRFRLAVAGGLAAAAVGCLLLTVVLPSGQFESAVPVRAVDVAARIAGGHPEARILADDYAGSPMLWLHPATEGRVGYDIRFEQYRESSLIAYLEFLHVQGPRWLRVTRGYDIIVASAFRHPSLAAALGRLPGWRVVFHDAKGIVAVRKGPG